MKDPEWMSSCIRRESLEEKSKESRGGVQSIKFPSRARFDRLSRLRYDKAFVLEVKEWSVFASPEMWL